MWKILVLLAISAAVLGKIIGKPADQENSPAPESGTPVQDEGKISVGFADEEYAIARITLEKAENLTLIANFEDQKPARDIQERHNCREGINGGFYSQNNSPIGLFVTEGRTQNPANRNSLFNGYVWVDASGKTKIAESVPNQAEYAVQTGPVLWRNGQPVTLQLKSDKPARRMVAGETSDGTIVFLAIYNSGSVLDGPRLTDVPKILELAEEKLKLEIISAINLDGGSASAFYAEGVELPEWMPVGSWWCIR